jgi:hypothetical protein
MKGSKEQTLEKKDFYYSVDSQGLGASEEEKKKKKYCTILQNVFNNKWILFLFKGEAITCFTCDQIPFPRDCKTVVKCGDHEVSYTLHTYD